MRESIGMLSELHSVVETLVAFQHPIEVVHMMS